jgi:hypothetical protein
MIRKYTQGKFLQSLQQDDDNDVRASGVKLPDQQSKFEQTTLQLIHYSRVVNEDVANKHYLSLIMLLRNEVPTFHALHFTSGGQLREVMCM